MSFSHNSRTWPTNDQPTNNVTTRSVAICAFYYASEAHGDDDDDEDDDKSDAQFSAWCQYVMLGSQFRLSSVCNVGAPYSEGWIFPKYVCTILQRNNLARLWRKQRKNKYSQPFVGERYYVTFILLHEPSVCRLSVCLCRLWRSCALRRGLNFSPIFLHHLIPQGLRQFVLKFLENILGVLGDHTS